MAKVAGFLVVVLCVNLMVVTANEMGNRESDYYNWMDEIAQAACTGIMSGDGTVHAVRRECGEFPDCSTACSDLSLTCFEALHVYKDRPRLSSNHDEAVGVEGPQVYKYGSCGGNYCGPNYCCCHV